jgi:NAD(P)-dependent dehydrogenase (short-subunit alcohol dehydrogenase family)
MMRFRDDVAIVTGGAFGIGKGIARRLASEDCRVILLDIDSSGENTAHEIREKGGDALFMVCDVTDEAQVEDVFATAVERFGKLDFLINNAGDAPRRNFDTLTTADWESTLQLNLTSVYLCSRAAYPYLQQSPHGSLVNIASLHAFQTIPGLAPYPAAKGGVVALTTSLAIELAPKVRVNAVAPGCHRDGGVAACGRRCGSRLCAPSPFSFDPALRHPRRYCGFCRFSAES